MDAGLATALHEMANPDELLEVFVHLTPAAGPSEVAALEVLGVRGAEGGRRVLTATLSGRIVEGLSDKPWIQQLRLSRKMRPLSGA